MAALMQLSDATFSPETIRNLSDLDSYNSLTEYMKDHGIIPSFKLLNQILESRCSSVDLALRRKYIRLEEFVYLFLGHHLLLQFIQLEHDKLNAFFEVNSFLMSTDEVYDKLDEYIVKHGDNKEWSNWLNEIKQWMTKSFAWWYYNVYGLYWNTWHDKRRQLKYGVKWLIDPLAKLVFENLLNEAKTEIEKGELNRRYAIVSNCAQHNPFEIVSDLDIEWVKFQNDQSDDKKRLSNLRLGAIWLENLRPLNTASYLYQFGDLLIALNNPLTDPNVLRSALDAFEQAIMFLRPDIDAKLIGGIRIRQGDLTLKHSDLLPFQPLPYVISFYKDGLNYVTTAQNPEIWARLQLGLAKAYYKMNPDKEYSSMWESYNAGKAALEVAIRIAKEKLVMECKATIAITMHSLRYRLATDNIHDAIAYFKEVIDYYKEKPVGTLIAFKTFMSDIVADFQAMQTTENLVFAENFTREVLDYFEEAQDEFMIASNEATLGYLLSLKQMGNEVENLNDAIRRIKSSLPILKKHNYYSWVKANNRLYFIQGRQFILVGNTTFIKPLVSPEDMQAITEGMADKTELDKVLKYLKLNQDVTKLIDWESQGLSIPEFQEMMRTMEDVSEDYIINEHLYHGVFFTRMDEYFEQHFETVVRLFDATIHILRKNNNIGLLKRSYFVLGTVYNRKYNETNDAQALNSTIFCYESGFKLSGKNDNLVGATDGKTLLAQAYLDKGEYEKSLALLKEPMAFVSQNLQTSTQLSTRKDYQNRYTMLNNVYVECLTSLGRVEDAAVYATSLKNKAFAEALGSSTERKRELSSLNKKLKRELDKIEHCRLKLDDKKRQIKLKVSVNDSRYHADEVLKVESELTTMIDEVLFKFPKLSGFQSLPLLTKHDLFVISASLGDIPIIEYTCFNNYKIGAFVIWKNQINYIKLVEFTKSDLERLNPWFMGYTNNSLWANDHLHDGLLELYSLLFEPILPFLPESGKIIISPVSILNHLPFQILHDSENRYVIDQYAISYTDSLWSLKLLVAKNKSRTAANRNDKKLLMVSYSGDDEFKLDFVKQETRIVTSYFEKFVPITEFDASPDKILMVCNSETFDTMHFSCHGNFDYYHPHRAGLGFPKQQSLTVDDIRLFMGIKSQPLVVLSACLTGRTGAFKLEDQWVGLPTAFLSAGAGAVVSSQWPVSDATTAEIFELFYKCRQENNMDIADALQKAILQIKGKRAFRNRPYYWGAFSILGLPII